MCTGSSAELRHRRSLIHTFTAMYVCEIVNHTTNADIKAGLNTLGQRFSEVSSRNEFYLMVFDLWPSDPQNNRDRMLNPFPHIDAFGCLCSRQLFENILTKEEIAQNKQFLLLPQCFPLLVIGYPFNYRDFPLFDKICSKSSAAELLYEGKSL